MSQPRFVIHPLGDDGEDYMAFGHVNKLTFVRRLRREFGPFELDPPRVAEVEHAYVRIVPDGDEGEEYWYERAPDPAGTYAKATWWML